MHNQVFFFLFGYHHPDAWEAAVHDKNFDLDSTGVLPIRASDKDSAFRWGTQVAKWYVSKLFSLYPTLTYDWSPEKYACWTEESAPEGTEDCVNKINTIDDGAYPHFDELRRALQD